MGPFLVHTFLRPRPPPPPPLLILPWVGGGAAGMCSKGLDAEKCIMCRPCHRYWWPGVRLSFSMVPGFTGGPPCGYGWEGPPADLIGMPLHWINGTCTAPVALHAQGPMDSGGMQGAWAPRGSLHKEQGWRHGGPCPRWPSNRQPLSPNRFCNHKQPLWQPLLEPFVGFKAPSGLSMPDRKALSQRRTIGCAQPPVITADDCRIRNGLLLFGANGGGGGGAGRGLISGRLILYWKCAPTPLFG